MAGEDRPNDAEAVEVIPILLSDGSRLRAWEEQVAFDLAGGVDPASLATWSMRPPATNVLKPADFNGSLIGVELVPLEEPARALAQALEEAKSGKAIFSDRDFADPRDHARTRTATRLVGFRLRATGSSSAQKNIGAIHAMVWYEFLPPSKKNLGLGDVQRYVAEPTFDEAAFDQLWARSVAIGRTVLSKGMARPVHTSVGTGQMNHRPMGSRP